MSATLAPPAPALTVGDLLRRLGDIPPDRVRLSPPPGQATEADVIAADAHEDRLCELVEGTLVEKAVGLRESMLAIALGSVLHAFVVRHNLGIVTGEQGMYALFPNLIRIPDVSYISWDRCPGARMPRDAVPPLAPNLAVEVLSESNTRAEMARKRDEYFRAGVLLVWEIDPEARTVKVYTAPDQSTVLDHTQVLDGGSVLPGFELPLAQLFGELDRQGGS